MSTIDTPTHQQILGPNGTKVVEALQIALPTLIDLALNAKQLHWTLKGSRFKSVHEQLDEVINDVRLHSDEVAERITTLGEPADGRAQVVSSDTKLSTVSPGFLGIDDTVRTMCEALLAAVRVTRAGQAATADIDPITEDLLIGITASLEKHHWMFKSQLEEV
ncbi:MAG: DNA starvation/stationary phase protection protein [Planctomycetota bacterium]